MIVLKFYIGKVYYCSYELFKNNVLDILEILYYSGKFVL